MVHFISKFNKFGNEMNRSLKCMNNLIINNHFDLFIKKFTNLLMKNGKKIKASKIIFNMLVILKNRIKKDIEKNNQLSLLPKQPLIINFGFLDKKISLNFLILRLISQAIENITPNLEVRKVRIAGSTYLVPSVLSKKKQETLALKWLIEAAQKRKKNSKLNFSVCLAEEILDASRKLGQARQKRDELHRLALMNRAYIRYRWW